METLYDIIKSHASGKGEDTMWESTRIISDAVEADMPEEHREHLKRKIYGLMCDGHYNEYFAKDAVSKMYYTAPNGEKKYAPYWTEQTVRELYEGVKAEIVPYNFWDFFVTIHLVASDNHALIMKWFPGDDPATREKRYVDLAVNWLNDEDNPYGQHKVWGYMSSHS